MARLSSLICADKEFSAFCELLSDSMAKGGAPAAVINGLSGGAVGAFVTESVYAVPQGATSLVLAPSDEECRTICAMLKDAGVRAAYYPSREFIFDSISASHDTERERLSVLYKLITGEIDCVVASPAAAVSRTMPCGLLESLSVKLSVGIVESVTDEFLSLFDHYVKNTPYIQEIVASGLERILIQLSLKSIKTDEVEPPYRAIYYIKQHLTDKISVPMLAALEGLSESRFYSVFKNTMGTSPIEYINTLRIERACNLLASTPMSVAEIGENCGFDDNFYFSKIFKKSFGISPIEWKKTNS